MIKQVKGWFQGRNDLRDTIFRVAESLSDIWKFYPKPNTVQRATNLIASVGSVHKVINREKNPFEWLREQGHHETFDLLGGFVYICMKRYHEKFDVVWRQIHPYGRGIETQIRKMVIGKLELYMTVYVDGDEENARRQIYTNLPKEEASRVWADWFWETLGNAVTFHLEGNVFDKICYPIPLELTQGEYVGPHKDTKIYKYWKAFWDAGFSRSLFFIGPPGTGKTTVAHGLARLHGGRLLHIVPNTIEQGLGHDHIAPLIRLLTPSVFLIDDIHAVNQGEMQEMLHMLEWINNLQSQTMIIATANKLSAIDEAMCRPGRFDEAFLFEIPDRDERIEILNLYTGLYNCTESLESIHFREDTATNGSKGTPLGQWLASQTEEIPPAYLMELAKTVKVLQNLEDFQNLMENKLRTMGFLLGINDDDGEDEDRKLKKTKPSKQGRKKRPRLGFRKRDVTRGNDESPKSVR